MIAKEQKKEKERKKEKWKGKQALNELYTHKKKLIAQYIYIVNINPVK